MNLRSDRRLVADVVETVRLLIGAVGLFVGAAVVAGADGPGVLPALAAIVAVTGALTAYLVALDTARA